MHHDTSLVCILLCVVTQVVAKKDVTRPVCQLPCSFVSDSFVSVLVLFQPSVLFSYLFSFRFDSILDTSLSGDSLWIFIPFQAKSGDSSMWSCTCCCRHCGRLALPIWDSRPFSTLEPPLTRNLPNRGNPPLVPDPSDAGPRGLYAELAYLFLVFVVDGFVSGGSIPGGSISQGSCCGIVRGWDWTTRHRHPAILRRRRARRS